YRRWRSRRERCGAERRGKADEGALHRDQGGGVTGEALIGKGCADRGLPREPTGGHPFSVTPPGTHKLKTVCNLIVGEHAVRIEAFVMRHPDEHREELWQWLLQRNARLYGVAFSIDKVGDVYLVGRIPRHAITEDELDRLLGAVLTYAD